MKKLFALILALMMVLSLAACGGKDDPKPSGSTDPGTSQQEPSNTPDPGTDGPSETPAAEQTPEELATAAFKQFGINLEDIKPDVAGEVGTGATAVIKFGNEVKEPLTYGAHATWKIDPADTVSTEEHMAYLEKVYNVIKAVSDDGEVHGSKTDEKFDKIITTDDLYGTWGYQYNGSYIDVYPGVGDGLELVYAGE